MPMKHTILPFLFLFLSLASIAQRRIVYSSDDGDFSSYSLDSLDSDTIALNWYQSVLPSDFAKMDSIRIVDLGLSVKWADRNIGADILESNGVYYAWGELQNKSVYSWATYILCRSGANYNFFMYNTNKYYGKVDSLVTLQPQNDVAYLLSSGKWRIPTIEEWQELITKCKWKKESVNGVRGLRVTASNGNSIFIPLAGHKESLNFDDDSNHEWLNSPYSDDISSDYWSSSLDAKFPYQAYIMRNGRIKKVDRYVGCPIRLVCE